LAGAGVGYGPGIVGDGPGQEASGPAGGPVAYFVVTSPVAPGAPVRYTDESYDTTPGAAILDRRWQGRAPSFPSPGIYPVRLTVTDTYGRRSTYETDVLVSAAVAKPPGGLPNAYFLVTSPVTAGEPVRYTDESYDLDTAAHLIDETWSGRQPSFAAPGTYPVTLRVEDSTGVWSAAFTRDVVVLPAAPFAAPPPPPAPPSPPAPPPPPAPAWTASASPDPASPGTRVTVTATTTDGSGAPPTLLVPGPLAAVWDGISYATINASGPMAYAGNGTFTRTITVPDSAAFPLGTYALTIRPPSGAQAVRIRLLVQAPTNYIEAIVSGT
jgi:PKD repeat protein